MNTTLMWAALAVVLTQAPAPDTAKRLELRARTSSDLEGVARGLDDAPRVPGPGWNRG